MDFGRRMLLDGSGGTGGSSSRPTPTNLEEALKEIDYWKGEAKTAFAARDQERTVKTEFQTKAEKLASELTTTKADLTKISKEFEDTRSKLAELDGIRAKNTELTAEVDRLKPLDESSKKLQSEIDRILTTRIQEVPEDMRPLVPGASSIEKLQWIEQASAKGLFKGINPGPRHPGSGAIQEISHEAFNKLPEPEQRAFQEKIKKGEARFTALAPATTTT